MGCRNIRYGKHGNLIQCFKAFQQASIAAEVEERIGLG